MNKIRTLKRDRAEGVKFASFRLAIVILASLISLEMACSSLVAQELGGLTVTPTRIVFEGRDRSAEVILVNTTSIPMTYRISFKNMRMLENGSYEDIDTPRNGELFADKMIRYSPRQVNLEPGVSQTVRLLLRKPANLADGEYRSHLLFQGIPTETAGQDIENLDLKEGELQIRIRTAFAVTIPVIARQGELSATAEITDLSLTTPKDPDEPAILFFRINRSGNRTVSGDLEVTFKSNQGGDEYVVNQVRGIAVLCPSPARIVRLSLGPPEGVVLQNGILHLVYRSRPEEGGKILAEADIQVP